MGESDADRSPTFKGVLGRSSPVFQLFCLEWRKDKYLMLFLFFICAEASLGSEVSMPKPIDPCDRSTASSSSTASVVGGVESREGELDGCRDKGGLKSGGICGVGGTRTSPIVGDVGRDLGDFRKAEEIDLERLFLLFSDFSCKVPLVLFELDGGVSPASMSINHQYLVLKELEPLLRASHLGAPNATWGGVGERGECVGAMVCHSMHGYSSHCFLPSFA